MCYTIRPEACICAEQVAPLAGIKSKEGAKQADILLPAWVFESIKAGRRLPRIKKYVMVAPRPAESLLICPRRFYVHALPATEASDEYNGMEESLDANADDCGEAEDDSKLGKEEDVKPFAQPSLEAFRSVSKEEDKDADDLDEEAGSDRDEYDDDGPPGAGDDVGMDDPEDDNGPLQGMMADVNLNLESSVDPQGLSGAPPGMGAESGEQHFDPERPLAPYVCYFDTSENAAANGLPPNASLSNQQIASKGYVLPILSVRASF